ncbi:hypothetical protein GALMADRAFT_247303 [Galerina marginata CBS 339.88]|uniref:Tyr recombinase domain-containing protein n=1 Tax=Galerina marginata (strain CBS 339.88) TaxID=685588 RepID=A0A067SYZ2_GALM3|nr:hypothetical protein GALMADRAFT_247303 [Galerina marginata CBS 339.88]
MNLAVVEEAVLNADDDGFFVNNDVEDEAEAHSPDNWQHLQPISEFEAQDMRISERLEDIVRENSREVALGTDRDYRRLMVALDKFLTKNNYIRAEESVFTMKSTAHTPLLIIGWIMEECDEVGPDGRQKGENEHRCTFANAMKMRSAATYGFGRILARGNTPWQSTDGVEFRGNPSISTEVSRYMLALKKRKHARGELPMSSRAITAEVIRDIYKFNNLPENLTPRPIKHTSRETKSMADWGGPRARLLVHVVITMAFICLLRSDEVLNLRREDVEFLPDGSMSITLSSRKNSPFGSKPFRLWMLHKEDTHLCAVRALARWIKASGIESGYLFRNVDTMDRVSIEPFPLHRVLRHF